VAAALLSRDAQPVKLTLFDKTPRSNWKVPWHQDLAISVKERRDVRDFKAWSVKEGVPYVQPPIKILERVVAVRLHLDDASAANGALRVLPGTHRLGRLSAPQIVALRQQVQEVVCDVPAGGAMLMSPLLLHASSASESPTHRRVLHFEFSDATLPDGLAWAE
jgi:ectoine hydroxylase-related dioxygenase (phytanoyl-CoA dioxygenase family)